MRQSALIQLQQDCDGKPDTYGKGKAVRRPGFNTSQPTGTAHAEPNKKGRTRVPREFKKLISSQSPGNSAIKN